jgi:hypothetical protein
MHRRRQTSFIAILVLGLVVSHYASADAEGAADQQGQRGGGAPGELQPGRGRVGGPAPPPLMQVRPKPLLGNAKPVRSCDSLASVTLPNTTIESAMVDASNPDVCRVAAITTHPPAGDKVRI